MRNFESEVFTRKRLSRGNSNFLHERMNHVLKRDFIQLVDYMVIVRSIAQGMQSLTYESIKYWQREMPFSIEFLLRVKFRSSKLESVIVRKYQEMIVCILKEILHNFSSSKSSLIKVDFKGLGNSLVEKINKLSIFKSVKNQEFQIFLQEIKNIAEKLGELQGISWDPNILNLLYNKLSKLELLEGTDFKKLLHEAMIECAKLIEKMTLKFKEFRTKVEEFDIFKATS